MYRFRPFRNSDPPDLAHIWQKQPRLRGRAQGVNAALLEHCVLSRPHFDPADLIVATRDGQPVGFVHGGFGPTDTGDKLATEMGVTQLLMTLDADDTGLSDELLQRSEEHLRSRGAQVLYVGGIRPLNGFYLGLYGGSELPGVLQADERFLAACQRNRYREIDRTIIMHRELRSLRSPVDRAIRKLRRQTYIDVVYDPPPTNWWEACTTGMMEKLQFRLLNKQDRQVMASAWFWQIEPLSSHWRFPVAGVCDVLVDPSVRRRGCAKLLMSEIHLELQRRDIVVVEVQTMQNNAAALALYRRLGYEQVDAGLVMRKEAG